MTAGGNETDGPEPPAAAELSAQAITAGQSFLWALLSAIRAAVHNPTEASLDQAAANVLQSAEALHNATGGFSIRFSEHAALLNGVRLSFEGGTYGKMLRERLESKGLTGIGMNKPPSIHAVRKLLGLFVQDPKLFAERGGSGVTRTATPVPSPRVDSAPSAVPVVRGRPLERSSQSQAAIVPADRRTQVVRTWGKLCLAVHEQLFPVPLEADGLLGAEGTSPPRIRPVRAIQELVATVAAQPDLLLALATLRTETISLEVCATNAAVLSVLLGQALGLPRKALVDIGVAALLHVTGTRPSDAVGDPSLGAGPQTEDTSAVLRRAVARLLAEPGPGRASQTRAFITAELSPAKEARDAHLFSRIVRVAIAYSELTSGLGVGVASAGRDPSGAPEPELDPRDALKRLQADGGRFDPRLVDLLMNLLRAFPLGTEVVLDSGERAVVIGIGASWDRPVVQTASAPPRRIDLAARVEERFPATIAGTRRFLDPISEDSRASPAGRPAPVASAPPAARGPSVVRTPPPRPFRVGEDESPRRGPPKNPNKRD